MVDMTWRSDFEEEDGLLIHRDNVSHNKVNGGDIPGVCTWGSAYCGWIVKVSLVALNALSRILLYTCLIYEAILMIPSIEYIRHSLPTVACTRDSISITTSKAMEN